MSTLFCLHRTKNTFLTKKIQRLIYTLVINSKDDAFTKYEIYIRYAFAKVLRHKYTAATIFSTISEYRGKNQDF
jgi:hypothetical protein